MEGYAMKQRRKRKSTLTPIDSLEASEGERSITVKLPVSVREGVYQSNRLDAKIYDPRQRMAFRAIFDAISYREKLSDGHVVNSQSDCLRWILDQVAAAILRSEPKKGPKSE